MTAQLQFAYACLDFSGRETVTVAEVARKLGYSTDHVAHWIEDGTLPAIDGTRTKGSRPSWRVTVEAYQAFVISRLTSTARVDFIAHLPEATRRELIRELQASLDASAQPLSGGATAPKSQTTTATTSVPIPGHRGASHPRG